MEGGQPLSEKYANFNGSTSITTLGTIEEGTWNGEIIAEGKLQNQSGTNTGDQNIINLAITGSSVLFGHITASGRISASGTLLGSNLSGTNTGDQDLSGYVTLAGSQTITGTKTLNSFKGTGAVTVTDILGENAMGSNSATKLATQQSIKAYADTKVSQNATRQLTHHMISDDIDATDVVYISLGEIDAENTSNSNKNLPLLAPVAGKLLKVFLRSTAALNTVDITFKLYTRTTSLSTNGGATEVGAKLMAGPTNKTMVTFDFEDLTTTGASGTNAIAVGDKVLLSVESSGATDNASLFITLMWEWDLS